MRSINKKVLVIALAAVIFAGGYFVAANLSFFSGGESPELSAPNSPADSGVPNGTGKPKAGALTYTTAVNLYQNRRVQFDASCGMIPNPAHFANGGSVMFDNRSAGPRTFYLDRVPYSLGAFGFRILTLTRAKTPATIVVDCGTGRNTGTILLQ